MAVHRLRVGGRFFWLFPTFLCQIKAFFANYYPPPRMSIKWDWDMTWDGVTGALGSINGTHAGDA